MPQEMSTMLSNPRREVRFGMAVVAVFFGLFLVWAALAPLDAAVVANGAVVVSGNRQVVQHRDGGTISRLAVQEGQRVRAGEILIELGTPELIAEERSLLSEILDLEARAASLSVETGETAVVERPSEWDALDTEARAIADAAFARYTGAQGRAPRSEASARIGGYRRQLVAIDTQERLVQQELDAMRPLQERRLIPITRINALERSIADLQGQRASLSAEIAATQESRIDELRRARGDLSQLLPRLRGVRARLERTRLRAPTSGTVVGLSVHTPGGVIAPGARVLDIVPDDRDLVIEARVNPADADDLSPGQAAQIRITAFSGRGSPVLEGTLRQISADSLQDETTNAAYFVAQIIVPPAELERIEARHGRHLRPGLPATVVVPTRSRSALQYLVEPLGQMLWQSFREQ